MRGPAEEALERLNRGKLLPVVVLDQSEDAVPAARALSAGGIYTMEITLRTEAALTAIAQVRQNCPELLVGAGTVTCPRECRQALDRGAQFIVSPGLDRETAEYCLERDVAVIPGCVTPTEIMAARRLGLRVLKYFPAGLYGGLAGLRALAAPFEDVRFIPTGGIRPGDAGAYAAQSFVWAVGGSWLCSRQDLRDGRFDRITRLCREAVESLSAAENRRN